MDWLDELENRVANFRKEIERIDENKRREKYRMEYFEQLGVYPEKRMLSEKEIDAAIIELKRALNEDKS